MKGVEYWRKGYCHGKDIWVKTSGPPAEGGRRGIIEKFISSHTAIGH